MEKVGERNEVGVTFLPPDYTVLILTIGPEGLLFGCRCIKIVHQNLGYLNF